MPEKIAVQNPERKAIIEFVGMYFSAADYRPSGQLLTCLIIA
jgi:hypothetical protein